MTPNTIQFHSDNHTEVLRLSKDGIWANPDIPVDEAAKLVLAAMEWNIKVLVDKAVAEEREATNNAYRERNQLVALLSTLFPSGKAKTAIEGWDEAWHGCVYIDFPWGQASWHYHTDDEWMFEHLPPYTKEWDGHSTEAKYAMIALAIRNRSKNEDRN